jgi:hypothetical protein
VSVNLSYKYKTGESYVLLSFVSVNLPYKHKTMIIYTALICVSQSPLQT